MKIFVVIPARLNSKRLPGKILRKFGKFTILEIIIIKLKKIFRTKQIVVATSNNIIDDKLVLFCKKKKINVYRGSLNNVYERIYQLSLKYNAYGILRINGDSPFLNLSIIKKAITIFKNKKYDIVTNIFPRSFHAGQSVEVFKTNIMKENQHLIKKKNHKEHITKFFYENANRFRIRNINNKKNYNKIHLALDTKNDFVKLSNLYLNLLRSKKKHNLKNIIYEYKKI